MKICLDTSAYVHFRKGHQGVVDILAYADEIVVPAVVLGELYFGFMNGSRYDENMQKLNAFLALPGITVAGVDADVAVRYGYVSSILRKNGRKIPRNDVWIASIAMEHGAHLMTFDSDFSYVPGLIVKGF